ncbi:PQQ-dependent sugar dehydrogenase [Nonomuraea typhae]|uniref:PQQ-dependent sugar dehydrogenase n=1 Tax=Nonomuraea typhae TaxID=2603600 RepID=UPI0012FA5FDF|nr:PQQ-dependent sugar dehydrogenase [Nonomuraea typhae]
MRKLWLIILIALSGCAAGGAVTPTASVPAPPPGRPKVIATGLSVPWGIAFLPGGDALVTERDSARVLRVTPQGKITELAKISEARPGGEGGLMGIAVKDDNVVLYYTAMEDNRIVRYRLTGDALSEPKVLVQGIPRGGIHNGGRLAFGPDGFLYASTGEVGDRPLAQDPKSLGGKILRMSLDGAAKVFTLGHRNVQGLAWDEKGRMYASEFGANSLDEINQIVEGRNYGWPEIEGKGDDTAFTNPIVTWGTGDASPSGMAYTAGSLWVAALRGTRLWQVPLDAEGRPGKPVAHFDGTYGRLRAVAVAPDGTLWVGTSNHDGRGSPDDGDDKILSISPRL